MMEHALRITAIVVGLVGLVIDFRSIIPMMLINRREPNFIEYCARTAAVSLTHAIAGGGRDYEHAQRIQAWVLPAFLFFAVAAWFLLVQIAFSSILWGLHTEPSWPRAFSRRTANNAHEHNLTPANLISGLDQLYEKLIEIGLPVKANKEQI